MIYEEIRKFIEKFKSITELKYIKGINNSTNAIGLTFEKILGKEADSAFFQIIMELKSNAREGLVDTQ